MCKNLWLLVVAFGLCAGPAQAQFGGYNPNNQPAVSPMLNIIRGGAPTWLNYYGLVRPQEQFSGAIQQLQTGQAYNTQQQSTFQQILTLPATGHASSFGSHYRYFNTNGMGGGMGGGMGMMGGGAMGGGALGGGIMGGGMMGGMMGGMGSTAPSGGGARR